MQQAKSPEADPSRSARQQGAQDNVVEPALNIAERVTGNKTA
jgi:hypothetical protein